MVRGQAGFDSVVDALCTSVQCRDFQKQIVSRTALLSSVACEIAYGMMCALTPLGSATKSKNRNVYKEHVPALTKLQNQHSLYLLLFSHQPRSFYSSEY